jgi:hypothetical protein
MFIWIFFGAEFGSIGCIVGLLILLFLLVIYGCGMNKMDSNLRQLRGVEAMSKLKSRFKK